MEKLVKAIRRTIGRAAYLVNEAAIKWSVQRHVRTARRPIAQCAKRRALFRFRRGATVATIYVSRFLPPYACRHRIT
ncbi:hypothetical protein JYU34_009591 [Plutella xylostella]|uniref:Uncharacterized protein n=1 Tax=Plutella xylostella TaxID=51655 RepID=A0ABQ7QJX0_PLUXY|nr:hypothetical protein JYU34_009591 [Plutella xylostella]